MKTLIAGNWKLNPTNKSLAISLFSEIDVLVKDLDMSKTEVLICPPIIYAGELATKSQNISLGSQNIYQADNGAYTGEISLPMLADYGISYALIGHSERRSIFLEDDGMLNAKLYATLKTDITPIFCIGETLEERESDITESTLREQIEGGLEGIEPEDIKKIVIAYEPVWAIGTGNVCSAMDAEKTCAYIRQTITEMYGQETADHMRILYGGSVKANNSHELLSQNNINGLLIGGASLNATEFAEIAKISASLS